MTFILKHRPLPGAPMIAEYECELHGRFELLVHRDEHGDPPESAVCTAEVCVLSSTAKLVLSAPSIKHWSVTPTAVVKGRDHERRPGMLDTSKLADGMSPKEWRAEQAKGREERRHQQLLDKGLRQKRIQSSGGGSAK